jgi:hypothetical protein
VIREQWEGKVWAQHCRGLLSQRHDTDIQFVPDRLRGDGGLDAYRFSGVAYQYYAPEEAYSATTMSNAQKRKINKDIGKLCNDPDGTRKLIGELVLHRWVLLTPHMDSRVIVEYARKKSIEVRKPPRPFWCHEEFEIVIDTDESFASEKAKLYGQVAAGLYMELPDPEEGDLFAAISGEVAERLVEKLEKEPTLAIDPVALGHYKSMLLRNYVRGRQQLERLGNDYSTVHAAVQSRYKATLNSLPIDLIGTPGRGPVVINTLMRRLADALHADAPSLSAVLCEDLAQHAIAQWFVDCPLYFPESA